MLIVTEPTRTSVKTAGLVKQLSAELGIKNVKIIGNKVRKEEEIKYLAENFSPGEIIGILPFEEKVWEKSMVDLPHNFTEESLLDGMESVYLQVVRGAEEVTGSR